MDHRAKHRRQRERRRAPAPRPVTRPVLVTGRLTEGVWCPACNAPVPANLDVCVSCGHHYMPSKTAVVTLDRKPRTRPRPLRSITWRIHLRNSQQAGRPAAPCAYGYCQRPGWWECCWIEQVDLGSVRWVFCGGRHRRFWLAEGVRQFL